MKVLIKTVIIVVCTVTSIQGECNVCHTTNTHEVCLSETDYYLCIKGKPSGDVITCPKDYVCTSGNYVCYPREEVEPSCKRHKNLCGICNANKVFACLNETTIAFCYGEDKPYKNAEFSYCPDDTVCDINSQHGFCTKRTLAQPSCITSHDLSTTEIPNTNTTPAHIIDPPILSTTAAQDESEATPMPMTDTETLEPTTPKAGATIAEPTTTQTPVEFTITMAATANTWAEVTPIADTTSAEATAHTADTATIAETTTKSSTEATTIEMTTTTREIGNISASRSTIGETTTVQPITTAENTTTSGEVTTTRAESTTVEPAATSTAATTILIATSNLHTPTTESSTTVEGFTVPVLPRSPNTICKDAARAGFFYADDPTCTTFVVCYALRGSLIGIKKPCRPGQYFPPGAVYCSSKKPDICK